MAPGSLCKYQFIDDEFNQLYISERMMVKLLGIFSLLAILIATLGIISLSTMAAETRTKEIGVRKVLGASVQGIVLLLSKEFLRLTIIAAFIAFPVAWWAMNKWLEGYAYKVGIGWGMFAVAALLTICIALITVSFQTIKAAIANPVKSLRTE